MAPTRTAHFAALAVALVSYLHPHVAAAQTAPGDDSKGGSTKESTSPKAQHDSSTGDGDVFGPLRIGPVIGVGLPNLVKLGITAKLTPYFGFGANVGIIPTIRLSIYGEATVSYQEYDAYARVYPFGGGFFLGSGIGYESVHGTFTDSISVPTIAGVTTSGTFDVESQASVKSLILTPQIGYMHIFDSGFTMGINAGAQVPIAKSSITFGATVPPGIPDQYTASSTAQIQSTLQRVGQQVVPTLSLEIGWMF